MIYMLAGLHLRSWQKMSIDQQMYCMKVGRIWLLYHIISFRIQNYLLHLLISRPHICGSRMSIPLSWFLGQSPLICFLFRNFHYAQPEQLNSWVGNFRVLGELRKGRVDNASCRFPPPRFAKCRKHSFLYFQILKSSVIVWRGLWAHWPEITCLV